MGGALILMSADESLLPYLPFVMIGFGFGVGTFKCTIPKVLNPGHKAMGVFIGCMFTEMMMEVVLIGIASMFLLDFHLYVFLGLYSLSWFIILIASINPMTDPKHLSEKAFKYMNVSNCQAYGMWKLMGSYIKKLNKIKYKPTADDKRHWLYRSEKKYGKALVEALILKFNIHKFYIFIAGLWVGVEVKYSYWMFTTFVTDRRLGPSLVIQPMQYYALPPMLTVIFLPPFCYWLGPAMSKSSYSDGLKQMILGASFLLFATALGWSVSVRIKDLSMEMQGPDSQHTEVRVLNGHFCPSAILKYFWIGAEQSEVMKPIPAIEMVRNVKGPGANVFKRKTKLQTMVNMIIPMNEDSYLKYANLKIRAEPVGELEETMVDLTDSFMYLKKLGDKIDNSVTVSAVGYCETLSRFTLDIPKGLKRKNVDFVDVFVIRHTNKSDFVLYETVDYRKNLMLKPGIRLYALAEEGKSAEVSLYKDGSNLGSVTANGVDPSKPIWLEVGDGPELEIRVRDYIVRFMHTLGPSEQVDLLVNVEKKEVVRILQWFIVVI